MVFYNVRTIKSLLLFFVHYVKTRKWLNRTKKQEKRELYITKELLVMSASLKYLLLHYYYILNGSVLWTMTICFSASVHALSLMTFSGTVA